VVPIPALFFFEAAGFLNKGARVIAYTLCGVFLCLVVATFVFGPSLKFLFINNVIIIAGLIALIVQSMRGENISRDFVVIRRGLLVFVGFALYDNIVGLFRGGSKTEALGFAVFLATLGYVAARRTIQRDQQLVEIQKELDVARRIQMSILPGEFPNNANFRVAARYVPMTSVAGDFYDFLVSDDRQAGLLIADASGHGVPAALIASMVKIAATSQRGNMANPSKLLKAMNGTLCGITQNQFVTAAYVHLDADAQELRYSAAAHPPMLLLRGGEVTPVVENGLMLAAFDFAEYSTAVLPLMTGDRLLLYTDGIVEAEDGKQEEFGQERLCALLRDSAGLGHTEAADLLLSSVQRWSAAQNDDLTLLVCDYAGAG
jgi:sigma-B regulation protein RsbU (phosphoserine phosphatase)